MMSAKILIVDDEPNVLRLIGYALEIEGYEIVTAMSGMEALSKVETEQPDLVILDIMLPRMSGVEVCQQLRSKPETVSLPIIMLSARAQVADKVKGLQAGADEYVTKPVDSDEIVARVAALLERTRRLRQVPPAKRGKVLGFMGAKGGVGTTTVALNVASVLARQKKTVIAMELRSYHGTFSLHLGGAPVENLSNLLELDPERINERELSMRLFSSTSGFRVLFGPQKVDEFKEIELDQAEAVMKGLADMADYTIIDLPCHPSSASQAAIQHCDLVALIVAPELTCVLSGKVTLELLRSWGVGVGLVGAIIVRREIAARAMKLPEIRSSLGCDIVGVMPPAGEACIAAQERGVPLVFYQPDNLAAVSLSEIANRLVAGEVMALRS
jgi:DNA-binding response OmpR family regulator